jgi:pimeloyl-ACP methyl ester carboxylesterase
MGSFLSDRKGSHGLVWIDPVGLTIGKDFEALRLDKTGLVDWDTSIGIAASGPVPIIYDRLALALMARLGPVVEYAPYDWRKPMSQCGEDVLARCRQLLKEEPRARIVIVAHSMGGLAAAEALRANPKLSKNVAGVIALGVPWLGSYDAFLNLRGEGDRVQQFVKITGRSTSEALEVIHTFWGLVHLMPHGRAELVDPVLYAPGPLSQQPRNAPVFSSINEIARSIPKEIPLRNVASDKNTTVVDISLRENRVERVLGPGDGTVPVASALAGGTLPAVLVDEPHISIPLDRQAIRAVVDQVAKWAGVGPERAKVRIPESDSLGVDELPNVERLLQALDEPVNFKMRDLRSLMPLL